MWGVGTAEAAGCGGHHELHLATVGAHGPPASPAQAGLLLSQLWGRQRVTMNCSLITLITFQLPSASHLSAFAGFRRGKKQRQGRRQGEGAEGRPVGRPVPRPGGVLRAAEGPADAEARHGGPSPRPHTALLQRAERSNLYPGPVASPETTPQARAGCAPPLNQGALPCWRPQHRGDPSGRAGLLPACLPRKVSWALAPSRIQSPGWDPDRNLIATSPAQRGRPRASPAKVTDSEEVCWHQSAWGRGAPPALHCTNHGRETEAGEEGRG